MKLLYAGAMAIGFMCPIGCEQKTTTSSNPNNPNSPRSITIDTKSSQTITQDKTDEIDVLITRKEFNGPVDLEVKDLPKGVTLETKDLTIGGDKNKLTLTLKAAPDATPVVDHTFHIVTKSKEVASVTANVKLTVKAK
jgi:hypothetical protein